MHEVAQVSFFDAEANCDGLAIVRISERTIGIALSLANDGDIEIFVSPETAKDIAKSLLLAVAQTEP